MKACYIIKPTSKHYITSPGYNRDIHSKTVNKIYINRSKNDSKSVNIYGQMEGLANFVSKSFEENSQVLNLEFREKQTKIEDKVTADDSEQSPSNEHVSVDDEPKDLSFMKINVCSSRPETPADDQSGLDSGR